MRESNCIVCDFPSPETTTLLNGLKKRLIEKSLMQDQEYHQTKSDAKANHIETFTKIVDLITCNPIQDANRCCHKKTYRDFYRKMRCSQLQFQENCQEILLEIASKCFQLDVIVQQVLLALSQISSFQDRVLEITRQKMLISCHNEQQRQGKGREVRKKKRIKKEVKDKLNPEGQQISQEQNNRAIMKKRADELKNESVEKLGMKYDSNNERGLLYWPYILRNFGND